MVNNNFYKLCTPSKIYFTISIVLLLSIVFQNINDKCSLHLGNFSCKVTNNVLVFIFQLLYILFWTYVLNLICKDDNTIISWLLIMLPLILSFVLIGLFILSQ
jgi:hypothetical protein